MLNDKEQEEKNKEEIETLTKLLKSMQDSGGISTLVVFNRKGRLEIYNGLIDNLYIISSRLRCIADNETNEQIRQARISQQKIVAPQGRIITN